MKFEKEHDPDPIRHKFIEVDSITDIPAELQAKIGIHYEAILENLEVLQLTSAEVKGKKKIKDYSANEDSIIRYMALLGTQITTLQKETENLWRSVVDITKLVNQIAHKLNEGK